MAIIAIAICLAATTLFAACDPEDPTDPETKQPGGINMSDQEYYGNKDDSLAITLRNVHIKYWVQTPLCNLSQDCKEKKYGEVMSCKGRIWSKMEVVGVRGENLYSEEWRGYDVNKTLTAYHFVRHEMYRINDSTSFATLQMHR
jgi:hypothetical protein